MEALEVNQGMEQPVKKREAWILKNYSQLFWINKLMINWFYTEVPALVGNENHGGVTENDFQTEPLAWLILYSIISIQPDPENLTASH
jgi:hypothetical protein